MILISISKFLLDLWPQQLIKHCQHKVNTVAVLGLSNSRLMWCLHMLKGDLLVFLEVLGDIWIPPG